jgi:putative peptidoglycan lipid II flippase
MNQKLFSPRYIWAFSFCYTMALSLVFQKLVLPLLPSLHAGSGLLKHDAFYYHQVALMLADNIHSHGWSAWSLWSKQTNTTGNVGILSAIYAFFTPDPALIIPVNAFLHATSTVMLFLIGRELWEGRTGRLCGLVVAGLFVFFPSALSWYSQPLKDSYSIAGMLMILYSWITVFKPGPMKKGLLVPFAWLIAGLLLVTIVKPYYLKLILAVTVLAVVMVGLQLLWMKHPKRVQILFFYILASVLIWAAGTITKPFVPEAGSGEVYSENNIGEIIEIGPKIGIGPNTNIKWVWQESGWIPGFLEKNLATAARTRAGMISYNQNVSAGSMIDIHDAPQSAGKVLEYLPRALQIGLFAPFPNAWLQNPSPTRLLAIAETACWYLLVPGLLLAFYYRRSPELTVAVLFSFFFITIFSFVTPNIGTLYRYRYAYEFILMAIAAGGLIQFYFGWRNKRDGLDAENANQNNEIVPPSENSKTKLVNIAFFVSVLTLISYLGFFARDVFMMRVFGAGNEMDIFYLGTMIPMFLVSVLSMPMGNAFVPVYSLLRDSSDPTAAARFAGGVIFFQALCMACLSVVLHLSASTLFAVMGWRYPVERMAQIHSVMNIYLLIMLTGGLIIIINKVLNVEGRMVFPALAQSVVPVIVILALAVLGRAYGIYAAVYGMLLGQIMNLVLVLFAVRKQYQLRMLFWPRLEIFYRNFPVRQYGILMAAALSGALYIPLGNSIAANLSSPGSVAIIGMGTKVIVLVTGVLGMGLNTVLLPYFSNLIAKSHQLKAQSDFSFFLLLGVAISVPLSLVLRLFAATLTHHLVANSAMTYQGTHELIRTIQYGIVQLPFFTCSLIAIKYITANQRVGIILLSSIVGLMLTIMLSHIFVDHMGVSGIALAMSAAIAATAAILVVYVSYLKHLPIRDGIFIFANWLAFVILFAALHYHLVAILIFAGIGYVLLVFSNWKALILEWKFEGSKELAKQ